MTEQKSIDEILKELWGQAVSVNDKDVTTKEINKYIKMDITQAKKEIYELISKEFSSRYVKESLRKTLLGEGDKK